ncbi:MAG: glycosyltransferase [Candidatus Micrarchaeota archaeon]
MPKNQLSVSIIVPTLNEEKNIKETLSHLRAIAPDAELIVSDGHSTDHTVQITRKIADKVVLEHKIPGKRSSIGAGRNRGAKAAKGEIVWFVDADTKPQKVFYSRMRAEFEKPEVIGVGCKIMPGNVGHMAEFNFNVLNLIVRMSAFLGKPTIAGNCVAYRKEPFFRIKGFDEEMQASEDQDLCLRISKVGKVVYMKDVTAFTSSRRLKKMGWFGLLMDWGRTTFNFVTGRKNTRYAIVREI